MGALGIGLVDIGTVSYSGGASNPGAKVTRSQRSFTVKAPLGIRIGSSGRVSGTASVKAWLEEPAEPYRIYLDNVLLGSRPVSIGGYTPLGLTHHDLDVVVPRDVSGTQADLRAIIDFQVVEN